MVTETAFTPPRFGFRDPGGPAIPTSLFKFAGPHLAMRIFPSVCFIAQSDPSAPYSRCSRVLPRPSPWIALRGTPLPFLRLWTCSASPGRRSSVGVEDRLIFGDLLANH